MPGRCLSALLVLLLLCVAADAFVLRTPAHQSPHPTTRLAALRAATTVGATAGSSSKSAAARPAIDPKTLPVPALKLRILQLAAQMDRGKLQVGWVGLDWMCVGCVRLMNMNPPLGVHASRLQHDT